MAGFESGISTVSLAPQLPISPSRRSVNAWSLLRQLVQRRQLHLDARLESVPRCDPPYSVPGWMAGMDLLPPAGVQPVLFDALGLLINRRGFETFVRGPILEPTARYFPDPWEPSARGVRVQSLCLLSYAGLGDLDAKVEIDVEGYARATERIASYRHDGAPATRTPSGQRQSLVFGRIAGGRRVRRAPRAGVPES